MSRLSRAVDSQRALIEAHQRDLRQGVTRFSETLGERAARPSWLAAAFGAGVLGGLSFGRRRKQATSEPAQGGPSWFSDLVREFGVPFALNLLQQYMNQPPPPEDADAATEAPTADEAVPDAPPTADDHTRG